MLQFVAGVVRAMFGKLDTEPIIWAFVQTGDEPLHDLAGLQLEWGNTMEKFGIEKQTNGGLRIEDCW